MKQSDLGAALGLSQSAVSRYLRRGMPDDLEGARRWRMQHLSVAKRKRGTAAPLSQAGVVATPPDPVATVEAWHLLLHHEREPDLRAAIVPRLQAAMRAVPPARRWEVMLFMGVWALLLAGHTYKSALGADGEEYIVEDKDRPWYAIAAGEVTCP